MKNWNFNEFNFFDKKRSFFKIESFETKTNFREITKWSQPLISDYDHGLNILFIKKLNGTMHYLCQIILEPGYNIPKFTNTIMLKNFQNKHKNYIKVFLKKNDIKIKKRIIDVNNSDEGGRFNNNQTKNIIYEITNFTKKLEKQNYIWISHNQMIGFIQKKLLTIELRNLFGILNMDNLK